MEWDDFVAECESKNGDKLRRALRQLGDPKGRVVDVVQGQTNREIRERVDGVDGLPGVFRYYIEQDAATQEFDPGWNGNPLGAVIVEILDDTMLTPVERLVMMRLALWEEHDMRCRSHYVQMPPWETRWKWRLKHLPYHLGLTESQVSSAVAVLIARGWLPAPKEPRVNLKPSERFAVLDRDGFRCRYCGATGEETQLHVDHVIPVSKGGTNDPENLVASCEECNLGKAARLLRTPLTAIKGGK